MARLTTVMRNHQLDASVLALTHELAQQIEEAMYIEVSAEGSRAVVGSHVFCHIL